VLNLQLVKDFGQRVKQLRDEKKISQEKLAYITGFHRTYIGMIERGERNISLTNIAVFAKAFELRVSELLDFSSINPSDSFKNYKLKSED
jgi:transcriptional regulator with XRE-family HTH domain